MKKVALGHNGPQVSIAALGTMYFGSTVNQKDSYAMLDYYMDIGGNFIDTANNYVHWIEPFIGGESERLLGQWMHERKNRGQVFLATKIGFDKKGKSAGMQPEQIKNNIEECLVNLKTEYIDLLYIHCDDRNTPLVDTLQCLDTYVKKGLVRYLGASNFIAERLSKALNICSEQNLAPICCLQNRHTYLLPNPDVDTAPQVLLRDDMRDLCKQKDIRVLAYSPLLQGAYMRGRSIPAEYNNPVNFKRRGTLFDIALSHGATPNQVVLAWMIQSKPSIIPLVTGERLEHVTENVNSLNLVLSGVEMDALG